MLVEENSKFPVFHNRAFPVEYKIAQVNDVRLFYREAGSKDSPAIVLLHGFPSSSRMFATLLPLLADEFHVIAPDYPGFGHSDSPSPETFSYTFDHLAQCVGKFIEQLGLSRYALYVQDYGGPIGFRLAAAHPERVMALIIQNAVIHLEGLSEAWNIRKAFWQDRAAHEEKLRQALLSLDVARQRHLTGAFRPELIDPDTWTDEFAFLTKPGMDRIQLDLMFDYRTNVAAYPGWQAYLREDRPQTLVVWGKFDPLFTVAGALAFKREVTDAEIHLLNASHFALDEEAEAIATLTRRFLRSRLRSGGIESLKLPERESAEPPINGREIPENLSSPVRALAQFYRAFNQRDLQLMAANWAQTDEISMDNPLGGIRRGWSEIGAVYEKIFSSPARVEVEFYDYTLHESGEIFYVVGRERGYLKLGPTELKLAIRTSRIFKRIDGHWRQVHHHGSVDDPRLLANYQSLVLGESERAA